MLPSVEERSLNYFGSYGFHKHKHANLTWVAVRYMKSTEIIWFLESEVLNPGAAQALDSHVLGWLNRLELGPIFRNHET